MTIRQQKRQSGLPGFVETDKYEGLINDSEFSDITLIAENKVLKVHRCILAKSSSVFADMFPADEMKKEGTVEIEDIRYEVLKEMIRFIYVGKGNNINTLANELHTAAYIYELD